MHAQYMSQEFCSMTVQCLIMFDRCKGIPPAHSTTGRTRVFVNSCYCEVTVNVSSYNHWDFLWIFQDCEVSKKKGNRKDWNFKFGIIKMSKITTWISRRWLDHFDSAQLQNNLISLWRTLMATPVGCGRLLCFVLSQARSCHSPVPRWRELGTEAVEYIRGDEIETFGAADVGFLAWWWGRNGLEWIGNVWTVWNVMLLKSEVAKLSMVTLVRLDCSPVQRF